MRGASATTRGRTTSSTSSASSTRRASIALRDELAQADQIGMHRPFRKVLGPATQLGDLRVGLHHLGEHLVSLVGGTQVQLHLPAHLLEQGDEVVVVGGEHVGDHTLLVSQHRSEPHGDHRPDLGEAVDDVAVREQVGTTAGRPVEHDPTDRGRDPLVLDVLHLVIVQAREGGTLTRGRDDAVDVATDLEIGRHGIRHWQTSASWRSGGSSLSSSSLLTALLRAFLAPFTAPPTFLEAPVSWRSPIASVRSLPPFS